MATTSQQAAAASSATQVNPATPYLDSCLSPGNDGNVAQSDTAASSAAAGNAAGTGQPRTRTQRVQAACRRRSSPLARVSSLSRCRQPRSTTRQHERADSRAEPGNDGSVTQSNSTGSQAVTGNAAGTRQADSRRRPARAVGAAERPADPDGRSVGLDEPAAIAASDAEQIDPSNTNVAIRVLAPATPAPLAVEHVGSLGAAGNMPRRRRTARVAVRSSCGCSEAPTVAQGYSQSQPATSCGCSGTPGVQQASQSAGTGQEAVGLSSATQIHPSNEASNVRVLSPATTATSRSRTTPVPPRSPVTPL